jgi:hypothetical protein
MSENVKVSKAQQKAVHKYVKANYDRLDLTLPKGKKDTIKAHAAAQGESVNGFIGRAIDSQITQDTAGTPTGNADSSCGILTPGTLEKAQEAAQKAGESVPAFIERAIATQAERDKTAKKMRDYTLARGLVKEW